MTRDDVADLTERMVRRAFGEQNVEDVVVREDDDWGGDPSLFIDVFLTPEAWSVDDGSLDIDHRLREKLRASGERRFAYIRLRDRAGEEDEGKPGLDVP
jgi:hypothetical protein